ncbi:hypothetical protein [Enterococcus termitis]|uniref:Uncharacterized protein n=1 Tax=Enterococcus termitis TaxID=332950 RepID=A0A1E5H1H0_9ENTE|nr:hypothetical protein [Enterococcus termitis]OEG18665.1 hypothetical protein BCR25_15805 [Enterococcus termitis]OJG97612.1 hypothetical protein RV18_GL000680 [Enterococcus termitis]
MTELKSSEAQRRASKKYDQKNKDSKQYRNKKSATKSFISIATDEDFALVQGWVNDRLLKNNTTYE